MRASTYHGGSASIGSPEYWWYTARAELLEAILHPFIGNPERVLDVGSADGPSVGWLRRFGRQTNLDIDPRGLAPGGVCGSALALPFSDGMFDIVAAFDVLEHCEPERLALSELARVLAPGGRLLMSVPAYTWAWSDFDEENGHHRRYTRTRAVEAVRDAGLEPLRSTYAFASVFPAFVSERLARRIRTAVSRADSRRPADVVSLPEVSPRIAALLRRLCRIDRRILRTRNLPFGSSVVVAARKPVVADSSEIAGIARDAADAAV